MYYSVTGFTIRFIGNGHSLIRQFIYYIKVLSVHCNVILAEQTSLHNISVKPTMLRSQKNRLSS